MSMTTWFSIFSGSSERLMRSFKFDLMRVARRAKIPISVGLSSENWSRESGELGGGQVVQRRHVPREREVEIAQDGLELVEIEVVERQGRRAHDGVIVDAVGGVHQVRRVVLEQASKQLVLVLRVLRQRA